MRDRLVPDWAQRHFTEETVALRRDPIRYLVGGAGDPLIMVHGLSGSLDWWLYNAPELAEHFRVYLLDLPGFGRQGRLTAGESLQDYVAWIYEWMSTVGIERVHFVGHSMGGHLGLRLAVERPEAVDCLVLVAPAGVMPATEIPRYFLPLLRVLRDIPVALLPLAVRSLRQADLRTVWRSTHDLIERHVLDILEQVEAPTLIIWGDEDPVLPFSFAKRFTEAIADSELLVLPGAGHIAMIDDPETFNKRTIEFLHEHTRAR